MASIEDFPVVVAFPIQWGDQDALAHVNNVIYFRWWETGRVTYAKTVGMFGGDDADFARPRVGSVLAGMQCNFRKQLTWPDSVLVGSRIKRVGNSSLQIQHPLFSEKGDGLISAAVSTMVAFDFDQQKTIPVSDEIKAAIRKLEGDREIEGL